MKLRQHLAGLLAGCMLMTSVVPSYAAQVINPENNVILTEEAGEEIPSVSANQVAFFDFEKDEKNTVSGSDLEGEISGNSIRIVEGQGISGNALKMEKVADSYFKIPNAIKADTNSFTLSAWVKYEDGYSGGGYPVSLFQQSEPGKSILTLNGENKYGTYLTAQDGVCADTVTVTKWHMATVSWDAQTKNMNIYVNGELKYTNTFTGNPVSNTTDLLVGGHKTGQQVYALKGYVDEIRIYDNVLAAADVQALFNLQKDNPLLQADKGALRSAVEAAEAANYVSANYLQRTWNIYQQVYEETRAFLDSTDFVTQEAIDAAYTTFTRARDALAPIPNYQAPENEDDILQAEPIKGTVSGQPFAANTGGSANFRIPSLITLSDGTLLAAADARWNHSSDGWAIDIMLARSENNGQTWEYSIPAFFNDSTNAYHSHAASFIDPVMVRDKNDKIYMVVDLYATGCALTPNDDRKLHTSSGFMQIGDKKRMVLYSTPDSRLQTDDNYTYYVGDYVKTGEKEQLTDLAPIYEVYGEGSYSEEPSFYMDRGFYLYTAEKQKMYCQQLGTNDTALVHQNVFFNRALLHVRNATYLYMITSEDKGKTWSAPILLNPQIRKETNTDRFYGVGPGAGLWIDDNTEHGIVMIPAYDSTERSSFIYSTDGGVNWSRSQDGTTNIQSSESALIQLDETTVRQFFRSNHGHKLRYTDHVWNEQSGKWEAQPTVERTDIVRTQRNQVSAIKYSKTINGKPVILLSTAATESTERKNGRIYILSVDLEADGKPMTVEGFYDVDSSRTDDYYAYSSITEQNNGTIGLLYESQGSAITYKNITREELAPNLRFDGEEGGEEEEVDTSLVAFFEFDGDVSNSIGETPAGAMEGSGVSLSAEGGISGGALHFTKAANSRFKIPDMINTSTSDFTLSSWVKYESGYSSGNNNISLFQQTGDGRALVYFSSSNKYGTYITGGNSDGAQSVNATKYHLVTMTWDASEKTLKIYVNGESYHSTTHAGNTAA
ncbi:MAG: exo-alpha-sialidase, partial [Lachnospiraceae bacterium]|nr:exo-alpha-sialidase [Lachnospiraceae bacterium]